MSKKLTSFKNVVWALCILISLVAVAVALVIAAVNRSSEAPFSTKVDLRHQNAASAASQASVASDGTLLSLSETADMGPEYIDRLTFLCDSSVVGMRDYGLLSGGKDTYQVWGTDSGSLKVSGLADLKIIYPADGSEISLADACLLAKPPILVICIGQDGLRDIDENTFKANYISLIDTIKANSPDTKIICCSICFVVANYSGPDGLSSEKILAANEWVKAVCASTGSYFCDAGRSVSDGYGSTRINYLSSNQKTLSSSGITEYLNYIRTHALSE